VAVLWHHTSQHAAHSYKFVTSPAGVRTLDVDHQREKVAIFTDSLSTVRTIESEHSASRLNLLRQTHETKHYLNREVTFIWVPSHIGITGNEKADRLANDGTYRKTKVEIDVGAGLELSGG